MTQSDVTTARPAVKREKARKGFFIQTVARPILVPFPVPLLAARETESAPLPRFQWT